MNWIRRLFGRRLPDFAAPPPTHPGRLEAARREAARAGEVLKRVQEDNQKIEEAAARAEKLRKQNHLGPSFWAWAESLGHGRTHD